MTNFIEEGLVASSSSGSVESSKEVELATFLEWLHRVHEYDLCRYSFGEYRRVREVGVVLAREFVESSREGVGHEAASK